MGFITNYLKRQRRALHRAIGRSGWQHFERRYRHYPETSVESRRHPAVCAVLDILSRFRREYADAAPDAAVSGVFAFGQGTLSREPSP
jgi:hypothetical protein